LSIRAADMPSADGLMMRVYAAMAQKERELISERARAALAAAQARRAVLGVNWGWRPSKPACAVAAAEARREGATGWPSRWRPSRQRASPRSRAWRER
jgi:DNA invertase Pin-like site-specific DNA recombinase